MTLQEKVILITGGGQGLGKAITEALAEVGAIVIPADIKEDQVKAVAEEINKKGQKAEGIMLNVTEDASIDAACKHVIDTYGKIDVLINNAGIDVTKPITEMAVDEFDSVIRVNLRGTFVLSKKVLPLMADKKSGHIVNIASTAAKRAWPNASAYHASKWGILGFTYALYTEAREHNVKATVIVPGGMRTPFILERFPDTPLNKLQDPKNVAETIKFVLTMPDETIIPEVMVLPLMESSWP
jgi:NAD(P)-dependent dehydrogenase (short-subunit alcohol dehydrogenase family)